MLLCRLVFAAMVSLVLLVPGTVGFTQNQNNGTSVNNNMGPQMVSATSVLDATAVAFGEIAPSVVTILAFSVNGNRFSNSGADARSVFFGSGIIIDDKDGLVLTCEHVIRDMDKQIYVLLSDRRVYRAQVLGRDAAMDTAVLKLLLDLHSHVAQDSYMDSVFRYFAIQYESALPDKIIWDSPLPTSAVLGNSSSLQVGLQVLAIGADVSRGNEAQMGIVTSFTSEVYDNGVHYILTDAVICNGYSGGPLVNVVTKSVVGINALEFKEKIGLKGSDDKGESKYAVLAIDNIKEILPRMINGENVQHATIGMLYFRGLTHDLRRGDLTSGAEIVYIKSKSVAVRAGLRLDDVVVGIGGKDVRTAEDARKLIDLAPIGKKLEIVVMRNTGKTQKKKFKVRPYEYVRGRGSKVFFRECFREFRQRLRSYVLWTHNS